LVIGAWSLVLGHWSFASQHLSNTAARRLQRRRQLLRMFGKSDVPKIQLEISPNTLKLQAGKLYFLPPYMFQ
jgi:ATP phosphoribosyltransferase regulatory subunit HisZ